jgi:diguanylate cyclase (GGDEF)-like protein
VRTLETKPWTDDNHAADLLAAIPKPPTMTADPHQHPAGSPASTAAGSAHRAASERVLVVGDAGLVERLQEAVAAPAHQKLIQPLDTYLAAIGELSRAPAQAVIGPAAALEGVRRATARALRELAPQARLVVLLEADNQNQAPALLDAGFDQCLPATTPPATLAQAVGLTNQPEPPTSPTHPNGSTTTGRSEPTNGNEPATEPRAREPGRPPREPASPRAEEPAEPDIAPAPQPADPAVTPEAPGDIDLIEAMLHQRQRPRDLAMELIRQQADLLEPAWAFDASEVPPDRPAAPVRHDGQVFGLLHAQPPAQQLSAWAGWLARWLAMDHRLRRYHELAMRDELTGVWNRRYFRQFLQRVLPWAQRDRSQVTLLVFDIDDFKLYNDRYGHPAGDEILLGVGRLMQSLVREQDVVARIGGDEFAVIFWEAEGPRRPNSRHPADALKVAQRFQQALREHRFPRLLEQARGQLTISAGLASFPWDGRTMDELLKQADDNALTSKRQGKNVVTFGPGQAT